ncbi:19592_t:CDS:2 [Funneliformis geosporum]|uniref:19592_t:CDS:1 n=1 Tax=Funneliformis geosporum TaxID=1117311 RepID=A0A9W4WPV7_9GLOM|nr:19592_t:CDS:2 [Funneliformis geosporum]
MAGVKEIHNYPFDPIIKFKQPRCSFSYKVIKEGIHLSKGTKTSSIYLFGLHLKILDKAKDRK